MELTNDSLVCHGITAANFLMLAIWIAGGYTAMNWILWRCRPALKLGQSYRSKWSTVVVQPKTSNARYRIEQALEGVEGRHLNADGCVERRLLINANQVPTSVL
jgi:hypothetical protein